MKMCNQLIFTFETPGLNSKQCDVFAFLYLSTALPENCPFYIQDNLVLS